MDENIVRSSPLFAALDEDGKQAVLASMKQEDYHRSATIFREGDPGDRLFIIGSGKVKVGHASGDGRENLLLPRDSEALFVCTRLRDEAHRFAITYHRHLRDKDLRDRLKKA